VFIGKIFKVFTGGNPFGFHVTIEIDGGLYIVKRISYVLALLVVCFLVTFTVYADALPKYSVREWRISAVINPDGSMDVEEYITFDISRSHEGPVVRHVDIANSSSMENLEVFAAIPAETEDNDEAGVQPELEPYDFVDQPGQDVSKVYTTKPGDSPEEVQDIIIYLPADGGKHTVVLKYRLNDLVSLYNDVAVLYWNPVVKGSGLDVQNMDMRITLPQGTKPDGVKPFVYGALEGNCEVLEDGTAGIAVKKLGSNEFMEVTLVFPKDGVTQGRKLIDNDGLQRISEEQSLKAEEMEVLRQQREYERKLRLAAIAGAVAGIVGISVCVGIWVKRRRSRSIPAISKVKAQTEDRAEGRAVTVPQVGASKGSKSDKGEGMPDIDLPADYYTPAELSVLLRGRKIKPWDMVATLIDLAVRRYLDVEVSNGKYYVLSLKDFDPSSLKPHEEYLVNWFFKDIGDGRRVSTEEILQVTYSRGFEKEFCNRFMIWKELVLREAVRWGFGRRVAPFRVYMRTPFGKQHYKSWIRFRKALKKLSHKPDSLSPADWERFFAYAFSLGIGPYVIKGLKKAYPEGSLLNGDLAIFSVDNFGPIDHWLELVKRFDFMSSGLLRLLLYRSAAIQPLPVDRNQNKSM